MREQATVRARQPWLAAQDKYIVAVDKARMRLHGSVGG